MLVNSIQSEGLERHTICEVRQHILLVEGESEETLRGTGKNG